MKRLIFIFICGYVGLFPSFSVCAEMTIQLYDEEVTEKLSVELKEAGISHVYEGGKLFYKSKDRDRVKFLAKKVIEEDIPSDHAISVEDKIQMECFTNVLQRKNINFTLKSRFGEVWLVSKEVNRAELQELFYSYCKR